MNILVSSQGLLSYHRNVQTLMCNLPGLTSSFQAKSVATGYQQLLLCR